MSREAMEVVLDHVHARRHRDIEAIAATLEPEVVHEGVREELVCRGRDEVLVNVRLGFEAGPFEIDRLEIIDAGDHAVLGVAGPRFRYVEEPSPAAEVFVLFTVRDGRIVRMRDFRSRDAALAAAQPQPAAGG